MSDTLLFEDELEDSFMSKRASAEDVERENEVLFAHLKAAGDGYLNKFGSAQGRYIKQFLRENSFLDNILPEEPAPSLDRFEHTEDPGHIEDMESAQYGAISMSLTGSADSRPYKGLKFTVFYEKYSSPRFTKHVDQLRGYKMPLRQVVSDNLSLDIDTEKDANWVRLVERICGDAGGTGLAGVEQHSDIGEPIRRTSYKTAKGKLEGRRLNNGIFMLNRVTSNEFLGWGRDEIGGDDAQEILKGGLKALANFSFFTVPHLATLKNFLVPNYRVYQFTEPDFMGRHYVLEPLHMYVKKEEDILSFHAVTKIGISCPNVNGFHLCDFTA